MAPCHGLADSGYDVKLTCGAAGNLLHRVRPSRAATHGGRQHWPDQAAGVGAALQIGGLPVEALQEGLDGAADGMKAGRRMEPWGLAIGASALACGGLPTSGGAAHSGKRASYCARQNPGSGKKHSSGRHAGREAATTPDSGVGRRRSSGLCQAALRKLDQPGGRNLRISAGYRAARSTILGNTPERLWTPH